MVQRRRRVGVDAPPMGQRLVLALVSITITPQHLQGEELVAFCPPHVHRTCQLFISWIYFEAFGGRLTRFFIFTALHETLDLALDPLRVLRRPS